MPIRLVHTRSKAARGRLYVLAFWALVLAVDLNLLEDNRAGDLTQSLLFLAAGLAGSLALYMGTAAVPARPTGRSILARDFHGESASEQLLRVKIERKRKSGQPLAILLAEVSGESIAGASASDSRRAIAAAQELLRRYIEDEDSMARLSGTRVAAVISGSVNIHDVENLLDRLNEDMRAWTRSSHGTIELNVGVVLDRKGHSPTDHLLAQANIAVRRATVSGRGRYVLTESAT